MSFTTNGTQLNSGTSAQAGLQSLLDSYNLSSLVPWAWQQLQNGATPDEIAVNIRTTPQWQQQYWMITARQKAGLPPISESDVQNYRDTALQLADTYGLPKGFVNDQLIGEWIAADKSTAELDSVLKDGYDQVEKADPLVRQAFSSMFGVKDGDSALAAYFTDPTRAEPLLLQQAQAAQFGGNASRYGISLSTPDAMTLAQAGVTQDRAMTGFQNVDRLSALFQTDVGDTTTLGKEQGVQADILGNSQMLDAEQQKLGARAATAKGKVGVEENPQKGFEGLGDSF
jgi:hypothetical protein